jgi:hypothetical protein
VGLSLKELEKQVKTMKNRVQTLTAKKAKHEKALASINEELDSLVGSGANGAPRKARAKKAVKRKVAKKAKKAKAKKPGRKPGRKPGPKPGKKAKKATVKKKAAKRTAKKKDGKPGLTDFVRSKVKGGPKSVDKLAKSAEKAGYKSGNMAQVIRLMVGKASDLNRSAEDIIAAK